MTNDVKISHIIVNELHVLPYRNCGLSIWFSNNDSKAMVQLTESQAKELIDELESALAKRSTKNKV